MAFLQQKQNKTQIVFLTTNIILRTTLTLYVLRLFNINFFGHYINRETISTSDDYSI